MLLNKPSQPGSESNKPSLYETQGDSDAIRQARLDGLTRARNQRIAYHQNNRTNPGPSNAD